MLSLPFAESDPSMNRPEGEQKPEEPETEEDEDQDQASAADEAKTVFAAMLPWGISFLFHAGLVLIAFFAIWVVLSEKEEEKTVVPSVDITDDPGSPMTMKQQETVKPSSSRRSISRTTTPTQTNSLTTKVNMESSLIGVKGASGGKSSPFGSSIGSGAGFNTNFMGSGGNARSIVFVVDASGSLLDTFPFVINELEKTIGGLSPKQTFAVIFFQGKDDVVELAAPRPGMKTASQKAKDAAIGWLSPNRHNIDPQGRTNPIPAIKKGLSYRPELMYLLSDNITGGGTGATQYELEQQRVISEIKRANRAETKINTIQFLYKDPLVKAGKEATLEKIADETGGVYKFVDNEELNIPPTGAL